MKATDITDGMLCETCCPGGNTLAVAGVWRSAIVVSEATNQLAQGELFRLFWLDVDGYAGKVIRTPAEIRKRSEGTINVETPD